MIQDIEQDQVEDPIEDQYESLWDSLPEEMVLELDTEVLEMIDTWMMSDSILYFAKPDAHDRIVEDVSALFADACVACEVCDADDTEAIDEITVFVRDRLPVYFTMDGTVPPRSEQEHSSHLVRSEQGPEFMEAIQSNIEYLRGVPQPAQRTKEWYEFRHGLMTASNVYKALSGSESQYNSLIYEKCRPIEESYIGGGGGVGGEVDSGQRAESLQQLNPKSAQGTVRSEDFGPCTNTNSPMHWGQKYEPVTNMLYQATGVDVSEFGCIRHRTYPFLGASPDGIVTSQGSRSSHYGRMVEIKNIVNREITGVPLEAYWVQMQLQMEVCDLDECDFVETRICEFPDSLHSDAFYADESDRKRGVILYLLSRTQMGSTPYYVYMPLDLPLDRAAIDAWIAHTREEHAAEYTLFQTLYWYLDEMSVVLVRRNRPWFAAALPILARAWSTIEHERIHGYEHRAPKRREPAATAIASTNGSVFGRGLCVIKLDSTSE
jgi:hypothetical protein